MCSVRARLEAIEHARRDAAEPAPAARGVQHGTASVTQTRTTREASELRQALTELDTVVRPSPRHSNISPMGASVSVRDRAALAASIAADAQELKPTAVSDYSSEVWAAFNKKWN